MKENLSLYTLQVLSTYTATLTTHAFVIDLINYNKLFYELKESNLTLNIIYERLMNNIYIDGDIDLMLLKLH